MQTKTNKTGCSFVRRNLFSYKEKELTGKELNEFEAHLRSCESCSRIVSDFQSVISMIDEKKSEKPNPFSTTRILHRIETHIENTGHSANPIFQRILRPVSVSFLMLIAVVIGFSIVKLKDSKLSGIKHQNDIQAMKSGLNIPDFIDENNTFFDNE